MSLLDVRNLNKRFGGIIAADNVSFSVASGELVAMIGPNGAGKSTVFNIIGGQLAADRGEVFFQGRSIAGLPPRIVWRRGIGRTFQVAAAFASMTVVENVQVALISRARRLYDPWTPAAGLRRGEALELLERVGMAEQAERPCAALAYGDIKRVEIAIALAGRPSLILMDEPTAGMAPAERQALMRLVAGIVTADEVAVLFTEHDMDVVFGHAQRIMVLDRGRLIAEGTPAEIRDDTHVQEIYLGAAPVRIRGAR